MVGKNQSHTPKLTKKQRETVIKYLAQYHSNAFITEIFKKDYGIRLSSAAITYYRKEHAHRILAIREKLKETLPVTDLTYRQMVRQMLIQDLLERDRLWTKEKSRYGEKLISNHVIINKILDSAAQDQEGGGFTEGENSLIMKFMLRVRGPLARELILTGRMPSLEELKKALALKESGIDETKMLTG